MKSSASNQKISWFRKEEGSGALDLTPQFQRRPVWTEEQASYLIDTILNGLPFPKSISDPPLTRMATRGTKWWMDSSELDRCCSLVLMILS
jgi:hypothetical protein